MNKLLENYIHGDVSDEEKQQVIEWLAESPENMREYENSRRLYTLMLWNSEKDIKKRKRHITFRKLMVEVTKVAAIVTICLVCAKQYFAKEQMIPQMQELSVPVGQRAELLLSDGTKVWLNSRSSLRFPDQFTENDRTVELIGEGYFIVHHNPEVPFIVKTSSYDVYALGTELNVKAYENEVSFETSLLEGKIKVRNPGSDEMISLSPGFMVYEENGKLTTREIPNYGYFKWTDGVFCFESESITSLIEKLQLYYDVSIKIENKTLPNYRFSGKFRISDGVDHVLKVLMLKYKFTYTKDDEQNLILIK